MDMDNIKQIVGLMKENELSEFELEEENFRISIKRKNGQDTPLLVSAAPSPMVLPTPPATAAAGAARPAALAAEDSSLVFIRTPIVGTFYRSPAPDAEPFVTIGQEVDTETVVCIIEAMKVMNEIKAEVRGVVRKILVENATAVQFDQPLFQIEPLA